MNLRARPSPASCPPIPIAAADGKFIIIGANGDSIFKRLCEKMGRPDMAEDARFANNAGRVKHEPEIDAGRRRVDRIAWIQ